MEILRVENVCKTYHTGETTVNALTDISFSVQKGEFVAIIGASGSGKSTLLHILGGIDRPTSGEVIVDGQSVYEQTEDQLAVFRRRQVGLIYQFYNLIPVLNVEENITLPIRLDGRKINKKRLAELLEVLGLTKRRKHLPSQLSGGQQQRVSIGRALINAPAILLADEPAFGRLGHPGPGPASILRIHRRWLRSGTPSGRNSPSGSSSKGRFLPGCERTPAVGWRTG